MAVQVELSQDLVEEILVWLPSQSLLRFKCISKQWNLLFSNQGFIQRHMKTRSSLHPHQVLFRRNSDCTLSIGTPHNNDEDGILFQPVKTKPQDLHIKYNVVGHCNGLMCIVDHSSETAGRSFVVWNPTTKEQQRIPVPGKLPRWKGRREYYGFGYDSIMDEYKIVLVSTSFDKGVEIQSLGLKKDSWEFAQNNAHDSLQRYLYMSNSHAKHVNGNLYWLIKKKESGKKRYSGIACFDLSRNRMREEESLSEKLLSGNRYINLHLLEDSLCMMQSVDYVDFNAWIMKENQVTKTKSWIKIFSVSTKHSVFTPLPVLERLRVIVPICFTGNGRVVMVASKSQYFVLYDPKDESFKKAAPCGCGSTGSPICCFPLTPFVESLVSPGRKDASPGRQEHGVKRQKK